MNINDNARSSASQCSMIREWLLDGHSITQLDALDLFGCFRLASRIHDLRERGMKITATKIQTPSGKYITQYSLTL